MNGRWVRAGAAGAAAAACLPVSGCTVVEGAVTGVSRSADGTAMVAVAVCTGSIDAAVFYDPVVGDASTVGWRHEGAVTDFAMWPLAGDRGWKLDKPLPALEPGHRYGVYAATHDDTNSGTHVEFTVQDLKALAVGQVRYRLDGSDSPVTASVASFRAHACDSMR
ncbi:hypothetical protein [Peterkaempfera sp. SMS 1(5)a]|uniref:hypothetical protein n=1 Tax=Peterkaempfera podocarpi TaxID=3232308 RepID=UPI0036721376